MLIQYPYPYDYNTKKLSSLTYLLLKRTKYTSTLKYCRSYYSSTTILTKLVLKCIKRHFTREFENSISLRSALRAPPRRLRWHRGTRARCTCSDFRTAWSWSFSYVCNDGKPFKQLCKFVWFNSRNLTESSLKALFSAARETSLTRFLAVPGVPVHTTVLGGCAHLVRVPRCQRRHRGGARSAPRREIEFSNSRVKWRLIHLSTSLVKIVVEE